MSLLLLMSSINSVFLHLYLQTVASVRILPKSRIKTLLEEWEVTVETSEQELLSFGSISVRKSCLKFPYDFY